MSTATQASEKSGNDSLFLSDQAETDAGGSRTPFKSINNCKQRKPPAGPLPTWRATLAPYVLHFFSHDFPAHARYFYGKNMERDHQQSPQTEHSPNLEGMPSQSAPPFNVTAGEGGEENNTRSGLFFSHQKNPHEWNRGVAESEEGDKDTVPGREGPEIGFNFEYEAGNTQDANDQGLKGPNGRAKLSLEAGIAANQVAGVSASAEAEGNLGSFYFSHPMVFDWTLLGEKTQLMLELFIEGKAGVEVSRKIGLEFGKVKNASTPEDATNKVNGLAYGQEIKAFAGAKVAAGAKGKYTWQKQDPATYANKLATRLPSIVKALTIINPPLGWLLSNMNQEKVFSSFSQILFGIGKTGLVDLAEAMGKIEGSFGAGGEVTAKLGISGGKFTFYTKAKGTWGFGGGTEVQVSLDILEGILFGIVVGGEIWDYATQHLGEIVERLGDGVQNLMTGIRDWFTADDKVREMVANDAHTLVDASQRAEMIQTLMKGWTGNEDEESILSILRFSKQNGDVQQVVDVIGRKKLIREFRRRDRNTVESLI